VGVAKITNVANASVGKYSIELVKDPGLSAKRLAAIAKRLVEIIPLITAAEAAHAVALAALDMAYEALDAAITQQKPSTTEQSAVVAAIQELTKKKQAWDRLKSEKLLLEKEQTVLTTATQAETRNNVWCIDKTTDLVVNQIVGTAEINGEAGTILVYPGGAAEDLGGILQPTGVSTPSAVFFNWAILPGWQKWKPTYRIGTIVDINYDDGLCDVALDLAYSSTGLPINQAGEEYLLLQPAVTGWTQFCDDNPGFPLVSNTASTSIEMTAQLKADLQTVNAEVNNRHTYKLDTETYGKLEHWTTMSPGGSGDCEDFALTKAKALLDLGYPASAIHIEIGLTQKGVGHAWLVVQTDKGDIALDNGYDTPVPTGALSYTNRRRQTGRNWGEATVILRAVPIYYMGNEDAALFFPPSEGYGGDRVVVEFIEQKWEQPIVIGFESNPRATNVNFYIGKTTSPFSEYARDTISARCLRYFKTGPNASLSNLTNERIKLLVLPCPVRVLSDEELAAIQAFRGRGGRVAFFAGSNREKANEVLTQLGSNFEIMPTRYNTNIKNLSGFMKESGVSAPSMFWVPVQITGWLNFKSSKWGDASLRDFHGYGLQYGSDMAATMIQDAFYKHSSSLNGPFPAIHCSEQKNEIEGSPPPSWTVTWVDPAGAAQVFPAGYRTAYPTDLSAWANWIGANSGSMPHLRMEAYGYTIPTFSTPYGTLWDLEEMMGVDMFGAIMAYEKGSNMSVACMKLSFLTSATGDPAWIDYYYRTVAFINWLNNGEMPIHDFFQNGNTFQPWPPYIPSYYSYGGGYVDGDGSVLVGP